MWSKNLIPQQIERIKILLKYIEKYQIPNTKRGWRNEEKKMVSEQTMQKRGRSCRQDEAGKVKPPKNKEEN